MPPKAKSPFVTERKLRYATDTETRYAPEANLSFVIETKLRCATKIPYETENKTSIVHPRADTKMFSKDWHAWIAFMYSLSVRFLKSHISVRTGADAKMSRKASSALIESLCSLSLSTPSALEHKHRCRARVAYLNCIPKRT